MSEDELKAEIDRLQKRLERERLAREEAEALAEQKTLELYRRQQELELLHVIADAANRANTVMEAMQVAVDQICAHIGWPVGHAFITRHGTAPELFSSRVWHLDDPIAFAAFRQATEAKNFSAGEGVVGMVLATRESVWLTDVSKVTNLVGMELLVEVGLRSAFAFPVRVGPLVVAVLEFFSPESGGNESPWGGIAQRVGVLLSRVFERKQAELHMQLAMDAAAAGNRAKSEFLATMSHEIRTPMNGIMGFTNLLLDGSLTSQQREFISLIHRSGTSLLSIINDILDFSKIEADKLVLEQEPFDLHATIEEVSGLMSQQAEAKGLRIVLKLGDVQHRRIVGDAGRVRQILLNLVGNAVKFTEEGQIRIELTSRAIVGATERTYRIAVIDSGIGIPADKVSTLFQKFSQADASTTRRFGGTGLGLAISKRLASRMGGEMGVTSTPGEGSTFWFTVVTKPAPPEVKRPPSPTTLAGIKVLVIDNVEMNCRVLHEQLSRWEILHDCVGSASSALEMMRAAALAGAPFHIALVDDLMPDMDGKKLGQQVMADPALAGTAVVLLTSGAHRDGTTRLLEAGFAGTLVKPILRPIQLLEVLSHAATTRAPFPASASRPSFPVPTTSEGEPAKLHRILLAEDNLVNRKLAIVMLERLHCKVDVAVDGREAVDRCHEAQYDLIFMDCQMPVLDGFEATQEIRRLENGGSTVPIVAVTANAMTGDREKCLAAGMNDYISKPLRKEDLQRALQRWLPASAPVGGGWII